MDLPIDDKDLSTIVNALALGGDARLYHLLKEVKKVRDDNPDKGTTAGSRRDGLTRGEAGALECGRQLDVDYSMLQARNCVSSFQSPIGMPQPDGW